MAILNPIVNVAVNGSLIEPFTVNFDIQVSGFHRSFGSYHYAELSILTYPPITSEHTPDAINLFQSNTKTIIDRVFVQNPTINLVIINIENVANQKLMAVRSPIKEYPHYTQHVICRYPITGLMLENVIQSTLSDARRFWYPENEATHD